MAFTFTPKPSPTEPTEEDNFGNFRTTGSHQLVDAANGFQTTDATGTPLTSPLSVTTGTTILKVPLNVSWVTLFASAATSVSEVANMATYFTIPASTPVPIPVANQQFVYLTTATTATVSFYFSVI